MSGATQRLFFALWPDASTSDALAALAREVAAESGGRATPSGNLHLTLAFLGDQPSRVVRELSAAADRFSVPAFELVFDRVECWRKNALAWAGVQSVPAPLVELHRAVNGVLKANGIEPDDRQFAVHVTLVRRVEALVRRQIEPPLAWHVSTLALVASELSAAGARYRVLSSWSLIARDELVRDGN
jgi:2'-5' RNA ligase